MKVAIAAAIFASALAGVGCSSDCRVEEGVLTMSWSSFCEQGYCAYTAPRCTGPAGGAERISYPACGLTTVTQYTIGGPDVWVYDAAGTLVGKQMSSDSTYYVCPSDSDIKATRVRAGRFPEPSCVGMPCACDDGVGMCTAPDAGSD